MCSNTSLEPALDALAGEDPAGLADVVLRQRVLELLAAVNRLEAQLAQRVACDCDVWRVPLDPARHHRRGATPTLLTCRWHHSLLHEAGWKIHYDPTTNTVTRPNGRPYEIRGRPPP